MLTQGGGGRGGQRGRGGRREKILKNGIALNANEAPASGAS